MSELPSTIEGDAADANHMNEEMELVTPAQVAKEEAKADEEIQPDAAIAAASGNIGKQVPNLLIDPRNERADTVDSLDLPISLRPSLAEGQKEQRYPEMAADQSLLMRSDVHDDVTPLPNKPVRLTSRTSTSVGHGSLLTRMNTFTRNNTTRYSQMDSTATAVGPAYEDLRGCSKLMAWIQKKNVEYAPQQKKVFDFLEGVPVTAVIILLTFMALYMDDVRLTAFDRDADETFMYITIVVFLVFVVELIVRSAVQPQYAMGFFFWLDLVAILSMIPDIYIWWDPIIGTDSQSFAGDDTGGESGTASTLSYAKAAKASRVGTKAGRIVRFVRLIRLVRVARLLELCQKRKPLSDEQEAEREAEAERLKLAGEGAGESVVASYLSEKITRKVVMMVLALLICIPLCQPETMDSSELRTLQSLVRMANDPTTTQSTWQSAKENVDNYFNVRPLLFAQIRGRYHNMSRNTLNETKLRQVEVKFVAYSYGEDSVTTVPPALGDFFSDFTHIAGFSNQDFSIASANFSIITTCLVLFILTVGAGLINHHTQSIVVKPIERMIASIRRLHKSPLAGLEAAGEHDETETNLLERTLAKLTRLLQIGFGEAGSRMIQKCLNLDETGDLNPMIEGTRVHAIYGFCDIRQFTFATECLKEDVMMYVNEIAKIVHEEVTEHSGHPNKNIGDAFLCVWRLASTVTDENIKAFPSDPETINEAKHAKQVTEYADKALASFIRIITKINMSPALKKYENHPVVKANQPDFSVKLGFGLHVGWAIEGPIGSRYKIDSSYLSPHVNLSEQLEGITKTYGVPIVFSGPFYNLLSPYVKIRSRHLDRVLIEGQEKPLDLYTFDIKSETADLPHQDDDTNMLPGAANPFIEDDVHEGGGDGVSLDAISRGSHVSKHGKADESGVRLSEFVDAKTPQRFFANFQKGLDAYIEGKWQESKRVLELCQEQFPEDVPTKFILSVMEKHEFHAPITWPGYRVHE